MYIGALATKTKMSIKTIRYYEEIALIKTAFTGLGSIVNMTTVILKCLV